MYYNYTIKFMRGEKVKSNFAKYIFIIFVIGIIILVAYKLNEENKKISEEQPTIIKEDDDIGKEIKLGIAEFDTINPLLSQNKQIQEITKIIYEPLLQLTNEYKIEKCLAKDWAKTAENKYLIKIDTSIKWSDGSSLSIDDVIFTIQNLKRIDSIYTENVKNIVEVNKVDDNTIRIILDQEVPFFEYNLIFPIMCKNNYEGQDFVYGSSNNAPIGTGKYKIVQNSSDTIILEKNENYKRSELTLEKITINKYSNIGEMYNSFKLGKIDLITTNNIGIENYIGTIGYNKSESNGREFDFLAINTQNSVLANKEVRQAISRAINRESIISQVYGGKYRTQDYFLDYGNWLQGEKTDMSYNTDIAIQILENNGWEYKYNRWQKYINYTTKTINFKLVVQASNDVRVEIADIIKNNLEDIGIKVTIVKATDAQYQSYLENRNYDMILTGVTLSVSPNLETFFGDGNLANFSTEELSSIMNEVKNITKEDLLKEKYIRIRQIYNDEMPYIGLFSNYYEVASNWTLKGSIPANWYNIFINIDNWYKN